MWIVKTNDGITVKIYTLIIFSLGMNIQFYGKRSQ